MRIILEFEGADVEAFEKAIDSKDDNFWLTDSIFWELDYGKGESIHRTPFGNIIIKQQMGKEIG